MALEVTPDGYVTTDGTPPTWASVAEVATITGATVDAAGIERAQAAIETISGIVVDDAAWARLPVNDRRWLRNAVAYQAAFMGPSPDYFERMRVASAGVDGQSASYVADSIELAPLARKALRKLSWRGSRVVRLDAPTVGVDLEALDDSHAWRPL